MHAAIEGDDIGIVGPSAMGGQMHHSALARITFARAASNRR
jgi:hypothetical protein